MKQAIERIERRADGWTLAHDKGGEYVASITFDGSCITGRSGTPRGALRVAADALDAAFELGFGGAARWRMKMELMASDDECNDPHCDYCAFCEACQNSVSDCQCDEEE